MLNIIKENINKLQNFEEKFNKAREFCQLLILKILDEQSAFQNLAFVGGTALRILYNLNRFSEDLDFCLINNNQYNFLSLTQTLQKELSFYNIDVAIRAKDQKTVASAFVKFTNLPYELGLSKQINQNLMVKFEVDQNPPSGYKSELSVINKEFLIAISHYDLSSLFAGKLHAILCRKYTKGRDYYDLIWYLGKGISPNLELLNQSIIQTEKENWNITLSNLHIILMKKIKETNFDNVLRDIRPFLIDPKETRFFNENFFESLLMKSL